MHVGFSLLTLFPGRVGGSETNVRGLLEQFAAGSGPERVTVLANRHVAEAYRDFERGPVTLHEVSSYRAGDGDLTRTAAMGAAAVLPRLAARDVPGDLDVLHHPVTVPIPRLKHLPTVTTLLDLQHHELPKSFSRAERLFRRWAYDGAARKADLVITISDHARAQIAQMEGVDPQHVETVPLGVDRSRFNPEPTDADQALAARLPARFVAYPANLWPHKNHGRLVEALAATADRELELVLSGQTFGRLDSLFELARKVGVTKRLHHIGYLQPDEIPALLRRARALIFPSMFEGFGLPPLEAMACGCPVACSDRGSLPEVVGHAAVRFDPTSTEQIATAMDRITSDDALRAELRTKGIERSIGFSWSASARRHTELYRRAAATRRENRSAR
jgi:glycosyltransferase involved in cell wall biosynthesis